MLHILEDDARLSAQFISTVKQIADYSQNFDILATDMYVNPSVYRALIDQHEKAERPEKIRNITQFIHRLYIIHDHTERQDRKSLRAISE